MDGRIIGIFTGHGNEGGNPFQLFFFRGILQVKLMNDFFGNIPVQFLLQKKRPPGIVDIKPVSLR